MPPMRRLARDKAAIESLASAIDEENINRHEPHGSQGSDDHIVKIMVDALKKSTKRRRDARRNKIAKEYDLEMDRLQESAIRNLNRIASQNSSKQRERLKILKNLLTRKAAIEAEILRSTAKLEKAFSNANRLLQTALTSRIERLKEVEVGKRME
ncbi:MAG: hypothetical protein L6R41_003306 [Letrouitia leprolyta]|nr:MAG: hypothetical protein L6R41_003306 [Letrouitia leprolyta]